MYYYITLLNSIISIYPLYFCISVVNCVQLHKQLQMLPMLGDVYHVTGNVRPIHQGARTPGLRPTIGPPPTWNLATQVAAQGAGWRALLQVRTGPSLAQVELHAYAPAHQSCKGYVHTCVLTHCLRGPVPLSPPPASQPSCKGWEPLHYTIHKEVLCKDLVVELFRIKGSQSIFLSLLVFWFCPFFRDT